MAIDVTCQAISYNDPAHHRPGNTGDKCPQKIPGLYLRKGKRNPH